jgi:hypothetical protein
LKQFIVLDVTHSSAESDSPSSVRRQRSNERRQRFGDRREHGRAVYGSQSDSDSDEALSLADEEEYYHK